MLFYAVCCLANSGNDKYICFNLLKLLFVTSFTNFNICYIPVIIKIFNFLQTIQYLLFKIIPKKTILSKNQNFCPYVSLLAFATVSICNINKIPYPRLQKNLKSILIINQLAANIEVINKLYYLLQFGFYNKTKYILFENAFYLII